MLPPAPISQPKHDKSFSSNSHSTVPFERSAGNSYLRPIFQYRPDILEIGHMFNRNASLADAVTPFGMKSKISPFNMITNHIVINFFINGIERKPLAFIATAKYVPQRPELPARLPIKDVVLPGWNRACATAAHRRTPVNVCVLPRKCRDRKRPNRENAHGFVIQYKAALNQNSPSPANEI